MKSQHRPTIEYTTRSRYIPETDTIQIDVSLGAPPYYIAEAHELGHRDCILSGEIPATLVTHADQIRDEICAWKRAAEYLREKGLWDEYAKSWARKSLTSHGIYWNNYKKLEEVIESL